MEDVFLSYSSKDRAMAVRVQRALEAEGLSVFWDQETPVGRDWNTWIGEKLTGAKVAVVLWSKASVGSPNVVHEATIAHQRGRLVPAVIEGLRPEEFPMGFYTVQGADLRGFNGGNHPGMAKLAAAVRARINGETLETPQGVRGGGGRRLPTFAPAALAAALVVGALGYIAWQGQNSSQFAGKAVASATNSSSAASSPYVALLGRWTWTGQACEDGPLVTAENDRLVFSTQGSRFIHDVVETTSVGVVRTIVAEPAGFAGDVYELTPKGDSLTVALLGDKAEVNIWTRCRE